MATLCRFVLPTSFSSVEEACVAEFNEYKKRMKEISQQKNAKRLTNSIAGASSNNFESNSQQKTVVRNPEQAREEAKKLVQSGLIKVTAQGKDHGFKRASSSSNSNVDRGNKKTRHDTEYIVTSDQFTNKSVCRSFADEFSTGNDKCSRK